MEIKKQIFWGSCLVVMLFLPGFASGADPGAVEAVYLVQNGQLTAEQKKSFDELPKEEQQRIRKNYNKFKKLPPSEQERLKKRFEKWQDLPPEHRKELREEMKQKQGKSGTK